MITAKQRALEQVEQHHQPQNASLRASPLVSAILFVWGGLFAIALALVFGSRSLSSPVNPFAAYADILPGQPWSNTEAHGLDCGTYSADNAYVETCYLRPANGIFSRIRVGREGDTVELLIFTMRQNTLTLGDVALDFGIQLAGQPARNSWMVGEYSIVIWMDYGHFSHFQSVDHLYLYRPQSHHVIG